MNQQELIEEVKMEFIEFLTQYELSHFNIIDIALDKDVFNGYEVVKFKFATSRLPRILHSSNLIKLKYYQDVLSLEAKPNLESFIQVKVALMVY